MKILYSHRIRSRDGQSVHLEAMVASLRAAGHEVLVVGPAGFDQATLGDDSRMVALVRRWLPAWVGELAELAYAIPATWRLNQAAAGFSPDVIYERANLFHLAGALVARHRGLPLLLEVNAPLAQERARFGNLALRRIAAATEHFNWRRASTVLPVTAVLAAIVAAAGVPASRIVVIPNGIDMADFPEPPPPAEAPEVVLGFVGFLRDWHGLDRVLRAIAAWQGAPRFVLRIVGEGPAREGLEALAAELGIADRLHFTGLAARDGIPALIGGFDIALQPGAVAYACPLKVLEYMAAGRAIVAPDQPNLRELLEDGRTALLFDPADPDGMWHCVLRLGRDAALRQRLGEAARQEIGRRGLTWADHARRVVGLATQEIERRDTARDPRSAHLETAS
ncbi:glycosyltransferase family 4 protein [Humitalea sp. 24SJ18S-53]|uniref:glycosyltransferase family 4 protein n=1 Tax=Humitalea sp. 24SJ18S-53 TaxID=3422307 RepID=UPI003D67A427